MAHIKGPLGLEAVRPGGQPGHRGTLHRVAVGVPLKGKLLELRLTVLVSQEDMDPIQGVW